jgi:membrane protease YdiL (CAAX protease family)
LFAAGILLGVAYAVTHNLWLPIALHFGWNFLQGPVLGLTVSGQSVDSGWRVFRLAGPDLFTGGAFGLEGGLVATATTVLGIMTLLLLLRSPSYSRGWSKGRGSAEGGLEGF